MTGYELISRSRISGHGHHNGGLRNLPNMYVSCCRKAAPLALARSHGIGNRAQRLHRAYSGQSQYKQTKFAARISLVCPSLAK
eukprot:3183231-Pleurochrysis_carterae.AAC.2